MFMRGSMPPLAEPAACTAMVTSPALGSMIYVPT
jgi:hypothetical protein